MKLMTIALEAQMRFIPEQRTEAYMKYGEGSSTGENHIWAQEYPSGKPLVCWQEGYGA